MDIEDLRLIELKLEIRPHLADGPFRGCCMGHWDLAHITNVLLAELRRRMSCPTCYRLDSDNPFCSDAYHFHSKASDPTDHTTPSPFAPQNRSGDVLPGQRPSATTVRLSPREHDVLRLLCAGRTLAQIAAELGISVRTVETYRDIVYRVTGAHSRRQLVSVARTLGWLYQ